MFDEALKEEWQIWDGPGAPPEALAFLPTPPSAAFGVAPPLGMQPSLMPGMAFGLGFGGGGGDGMGLGGPAYPKRPSSQPIPLHMTFKPPPKLLNVSRVRPPLPPRPFSSNPPSSACTVTPPVFLPPFLSPRLPSPSPTPLLPSLPPQATYSEMVAQGLETFGDKGASLVGMRKWIQQYYPETARKHKASFNALTKKAVAKLVAEGIAVKVRGTFRMNPEYLYRRGIEVRPDTALCQKTEAHMCCY